MTKYKYYFKKPKSEIVKDIFRALAISGMIYVAASSPYFALNLSKILKGLKNYKEYSKKRVYDTFYRLRKEGYIKMNRKGNQVYISLTEKGRKKAGWLQIDDLKIKKPKKWDGKWRIVMFDIIELKKLHREAFRGKLKELNFQPIQKSVWVCPYNCKDEIDLLRNFFGLSEDDLRLVVAEKIGKDSELREVFKL